jgi:hypothetical protein
MHSVECPYLESYATDHLVELRQAAKVARQVKALNSHSERPAFGGLAAQAGRLLVRLGNRLEQYGWDGRRCERPISKELRLPEPIRF